MYSVVDTKNALNQQKVNELLVAFGTAKYLFTNDAIKSIKDKDGSINTEILESLNREVLIFYERWKKIIHKKPENNNNGALCIYPCYTWLNRGKRVK